jgi:putative hydrolase of the HAD superfamily|nr:HAD family hydrolase [Neorhizobium tomejilense]
MNTSPMIVFDLDDTLFLERDFAISGFRAVAEWLKGRSGTSHFVEQCIDAFDSGHRSLIFDRVLEAQGVTCDDTLINTMVYIYRHHRPRISLAPDAARFLANGGRFAIISDGHAATQALKLESLRIASLFEYIILTDSLGRKFWKPSKRAFQMIQDWSALQPGELTYVADNPTKDFISPRSLGWLTVRVARAERVHRVDPPSPEHEAHAVIPHLDLLHQALELIGASASAPRPH